MRTICVVALGVVAWLLAPYATAQSETQKVREAIKGPWSLSLEERIALRTNPGAARDRVDRIRSQSSATSKMRRVADQFDGRMHPELFLPHEVFDQLIKLAFLTSPRTSQTVREGFMAEVTRRKLPADFWQRLQSISAAYIADSWAVTDLLASDKERRGPAQQLRAERLSLKYKDACRNRADALAAARNEFGLERFDRFLYEVIAPGMFVVADRLPASKDLREAEGGCR